MTSDVRMVRTTPFPGNNPIPITYAQVAAQTRYQADGKPRPTAPDAFRRGRGSARTHIGPGKEAMAHN